MRSGSLVRAGLKLPVLCWIVLLCPALTLANMTAPRAVPSPSGALEAMSQGLTALSEELIFDCGEICRIRAVYRIRVERAGDYTLAFILPRAEPVEVRAGGRLLKVDSHEFNWLLPEMEQRPASIMEKAAMARARFTARLAAGVQTMDIRYQQAWGEDQRFAGGYFHRRKPARRISYELWPLKEWSLDPGFRLTVRISIDPDTALHKGAVVWAFEDILGPGRMLRVAPVAANRQGVDFHLEFGSGFPDRLRLMIGGARVLQIEHLQAPEVIGEESGSP